MNDLDILIGRACGQLTQRANNRATGSDNEDVGGLLFFGNPMETTPRRLLLDERLSPIDKIGWMAFRMTAAQDRETAFPSYETLQRLLSSRADGSTASRSTVNRVVFILRLTRWLTLCHQARNTLNGRMVGNIYSLHDEPISIVDASRLDTSYISFVNKCRSHGHQSVRKVAEIVFQELVDDQSVHHLLTQLGLFEGRLKDHSLLNGERKANLNAANEAVEIRTQAADPSSNFEPSDVEIRTHGKSAEFDFVRPAGTNSNPVDSIGRAPRVRNSNSYTVRTVLTSVCKNVQTTREREDQDPAPATTTASLDWSKLTLSTDEQATISHHLQPVSPDLHQVILDEAAARKSGIRNMTGYILGLIEKARIGGLKITQSPGASGSGSSRASPQAHIPTSHPLRPSQTASTAPALDEPRSSEPVDVQAVLRSIYVQLGRTPAESPPQPGEK